MRKLLIIIATLIAVITPLIVVAAPRITGNGKLERELAAVRKAVVKYNNVDVAIADGYLPTEACAELPGQGGMGYHYVNPKLASDLTSDPLKPEILLYIATDEGLKLAGVEYFQADAGQPRPEALGQAFDGPMPGHEPGMPPHYDLHAWIMQPNPSGMFAAWHPAVHCNGAAAH